MKEKVKLERFAIMPLDKKEYRVVSVSNLIRPKVGDKMDDNEVQNSLIDKEINVSIVSAKSF